MKLQELLTEIGLMRAREYVGGEDDLRSTPQENSKLKGKLLPLPGGSGYKYSVSNGDTKYGRPSIDIRIWDPKNDSHEKWGTTIGWLRLDPAMDFFPIPNSHKVDTITVHEDYRGQSIAKSLYGIALTILQLNLIAGDLQTPAGARNWVSLNNIPGVEIMGYVKVDDFYYDSTSEHKIVDALGQLGAIRVDDSDYFLFPVKASDNGKRLEAEIQNILSKIYKKRGSFITGMIARWVQ